MKRSLKAYFTFSIKERTAVFVLLFLIALFLVMPNFYSDTEELPKISKEIKDFLAKNEQISANSDSVYDDNDPSERKTTIKTSFLSSLFPFDPNTISANEWKRLGLREKTVQTILHYRSKGGVFFKPEDIRKIWGLPRAEADQLIPFIKISKKDFSTFKQQYTNTQPTKNENPKYNAQPQKIDINLAGIEEWKALPGIGEVLANRIVKFRERLGGFMHIEQVGKTYGLSDSVFKQLIPLLILTNTSIQQMDLNAVSAYDLKNRAALSDMVAKAIIGYRQQYGRFEKVDDLKKIVFITDSIYQKLEKMVKVE